MTKRSDCIEMTLRIQEKIALETRDLSPEQRRLRLKRRVSEGYFADLWAKSSTKPLHPEATSVSSRPKKEKAFDCVEMKRQIQGKIAEETKGMTVKERMAYYRRQAEQSSFRNLLKRRTRPSGQSDE